MPDVAGFSNLHSITKENIEFEVPKEPGCYVLYRSTGAVFEVYYTGRADYDLTDRLRDYIGTRYLYFRFLNLPNRKAAFEMECKVYHNLKPVDNVIHPDASDGTNYTCPMAGCPRAQRY
jgi:hypothetical protein